MVLGHEKGKLSHKKRKSEAGSVSDLGSGQYDCPETDRELFYLLAGDGVGAENTLKMISKA